ncbi:cysteine proteinase [Metschnikowia bicuspidata var. bicuspidata NRRL YB-4993]|uniref:Ubiquitin carboxyl-terminal hydrolase n=1 Tax=Metschnikowia bicuspidata var. bicuspidata NRRL YB-4993 TaxID=869754 RepID=A0A1A0HBE5_9ASCO|nr:cysteine proteinase [Metschnikowia bicuspidata var. bicuspidata NRRL YB-4993]OBA21197.1 cysteine proteinase [Metschnikowia bicuspidata var. bicuspidata NRRL YB-4993]
MCEYLGCLKGSLDERDLKKCAVKFSDDLMRTFSSSVTIINKVLTLLEMYKYQIKKLKLLSYCDHETAFFCFDTSAQLIAFLKAAPESKYGPLINDISSTLEALRPSFLDVQMILKAKPNLPNRLESRFVQLRIDKSKSYTPMHTLKFQDYISPSDLNHHLRSSPDLTLVVDFRSRKEFEYSRINFLNVVNIEPKNITSLFDKNPSPTDSDLEKLLERTLSNDDLHLFRKRHDFELVVIYNFKFSVHSDNKFESLTPILTEDHSSLITDNPFKLLIELFMYRNQFLSSRLRNYPLFLNGGLKRWYELYGEAGLSREISKPVDQDINQTENTAEGQQARYLRTFQDYILSGSENSNMQIPRKGGNELIRIFEESSPRNLPVNVQRSPSGSPNFSNYISTQDELNFCTGLSNLGNSCYMNCILQCLVATPYLSAFFIPNHSSVQGHQKKTFKDHINLKNSLGLQGIITVTFAELLMDMLRNKGSYLTPTKFKAITGSLSPAKQFATKEQQDCIEFLNFMLDSLHEDLNQRLAQSAEERMGIMELSKEQESVRESLPVRLASTIEWERYLKLNFSVVVDIFQGQYVSQLRCLECQLTSSTYNSFSTLSLPIPETFDKKARPILLFDCLEKFVETELLDDDNKWHCPRCKKFSRLTKKLVISRLPKILIIHFKRFKIDYGRFKKLENFIKYPVNSDLDLTAYWPTVGTYINSSSTHTMSEREELRCLSNLPERLQSPPFRYRLYGVVNHFGNLTTGHYTSYVKKSNIPDEWCYFDDSKVLRGCPEAKVLNDNAYCLFYKRI